jgi:hypothetical protein
LAKNWYQARLACKTLNAELASNRDKGEKVGKYFKSAFLFIFRLYDCYACRTFWSDHLEEI